MKVSELEGALLDYWVARADGLEAEIIDGLRETKHCFVGSWNEGGYYFKPSTDWAHGGPIIERERIGVLPRGGEWAAWAIEDMDPSGTGESALVAAMRAYVASKFGNEVADAGSIPDRESN
ncbi:DUF2591 domain-containing protein [Cupriavidus necator]